MAFWEKTELFFFAFYHIFGALLTLSIIVSFALFHFRHAREHKKLSRRLRHKDPEKLVTRRLDCGRKKKGVTLIFGTQDLLDHHDPKIVDMAKNCRQLMVHQIALAVAFAVIYALLIAARTQIFS